MIKSMTGYGTAGVQTDTGRSYSIEVKSVNHRYCDVNVKLPGKLSFLDQELKALVKKRFNRGRFDIYVGVDEFGKGSKQITFDKELAAQYLAQLQELGEFLGIEARADLLAITRMPDVLRVEPVELDQDEVRRQLTAILVEALESLEQMRIHEGEVLDQDIRGNLGAIRSIVDTVQELAKASPAQYKAALEERLKRLTDGVKEIDPDRLAQEVAVFCDRIDVSEEITRLYGHLDHFLHVSEANEAVGRKLDFLIQEMNREINTIGSKSNNAEITKQVVDVKAILEKIREQVQNVE